MFSPPWAVYEKGPGCSGAHGAAITPWAALHPLEMLEDLSVDNSLSVLSLSELALPTPSPQQLITARLRPNMAVIWPTPAPNPIIKPTCLNIYHWHGLFQLLETLLRLCPAGLPVTGLLWSIGQKETQLDL